MPTPHRWATIPEAVEYSRYATRTLMKRIADGILPAYLPRGSRLLRVDLNDVDAMIIADGRIPSAHLAKTARNGDGGDQPPTGPHTAGLRPRTPARPRGATAKNLPAVQRARAGNGGGYESRS
jgi:hypothetical protein